MRTGQTLSTIIALALIACSCKTMPPETISPGKVRTVRIETEPAGMTIYFSIAGTQARADSQREYVGRSPCEVQIECDEQGRFVNRISSFARPVATFYADPPAHLTNIFAQKQTFAVPAIFIRPPKIPRAVFFDMTKAK